jgi:deoxycytidylate deaminase
MQLMRDVMVEHPASHRCKHIAIIYRGSTVVAIGYNQAKTHPLQARYAASPLKLHLHAEIDAIVRSVRRRVDLTECGIIVGRINGDKFCESQPCSGCWSAIKAFGFKEVQWTTRAGGIDKIRI